MSETNGGMRETNGDYRVQLDVYNGPLDLLLYLVRRDEVDIYDIPIARVTEQYVAYVELLRALDPNTAGEFLVMAATLMEVKSRTLLPRPPIEEDDDFVDPRLELVRQLLEYKKFKDAAESLHDAAQRRSLRFEHPPHTPENDAEPGADAVDLEDVQVWDLISAFHELMAEVGRGPVTHDVIYDDTPIALHAADLMDRLQRAGGSLEFASIFAGLGRSEMIGLFLALLELVRQHRVRAEQDKHFDTIHIHVLDDAEPIADSMEVMKVEDDSSEDAPIVDAPIVDAPIDEASVDVDNA
jgi:segregation and condensation protein A